MVFLHSILILLLWSIIGLPLSFLRPKTKNPYPRLLLAPHIGFASIAIIAATAYFLNLAVSTIALPMGLVALACLVFGVITFWNRRRPIVQINPSANRARGKSILFSAAFASIVVLVHGLPFIVNTNLVKYAYAGTDGSAYIATAEYDMHHGIKERPTRDLDHPFSELVRALTDTNYAVDKPGTMVTLAFLSSFFGRLPHEMFSPLMLSATVLLFTSTYALGLSIGLPVAAAALAGLLGAINPSVLALTSNTYLGASLTLPLLPALLVFAQGLLRARESALLFSIVYAGYWLISPPNSMIPPAVIGLYLVWCIWTERRSGVLKMAANGVMAGFVFAVLNSVTYSVLLRSLRFVNYAFVGRTDMSDTMRAWSWNLFWHAIGIGPIMAAPATVLPRYAWAALACMALLAFVYLRRCVVQRDFNVLFFAYVAFCLIVLVGGVARGFRSFEVLARVCEQLAFLHGLVYMSVATGLVGAKRPRGPRVIFSIALAAAVLFAAIYPVKPFVDFDKNSIVQEPQLINQYTRTNIAERQTLETVLAGARVLLSSGVPNYTSVANIAALLSNIRLSLPPSYLQFFFLKDSQLPGDYYCASTVLLPRLFQDIHEPVSTRSLFEGDSFRLIRNDLIPFFDEETFPLKHGYDVYSLKRYSYTQARVLDGATTIHICSEIPRSVRLSLRYVPPSLTQELSVRVSPSRGAGRVFLGSSGMASTESLELVAGQNQIEVNAPKTEIGILGISVNADFGR